jgi:hypothetical protein
MSRGIRLTPDELGAILVTIIVCHCHPNAVIDSIRFGVMGVQGDCHPDAVINSIRFGVMGVQGDGGTRARTAETSFLVEAVMVTVSVDGSRGVQHDRCVHRADL